MNRVLLLGFSVTMLSDGYSTILKNKLYEEDGVELVVCGFGALQPDIVPSMLHHILKNSGPFDAVVCEISTSVYSSSSASSLKDFISYIYSIVNVSHSYDVKLAFLSLFRDFKEQKFNVVNTINQVCKANSIPHIDIYKELDYSDALTHLRDPVHTNKLGASFQAEQTLLYIRDWLLLNDPCGIKRLASSLSYEMLTFGDQGNDVRTFSRRDFKCNVACTSAKQDDTYVVYFNSPVKVTHIMFVIGPDGGDSLITVNGHNIPVKSYDERAYFERLAVHKIDIEVRGWVTIRVKQYPGLPDVRLVKGALSDSERLLKLFSLCYTATSD